MPSIIIITTILILSISIWGGITYRTIINDITYTKKYYDIQELKINILRKLYTNKTPISIQDINNLFLVNDRYVLDTTISELVNGQLTDQTKNELTLTEVGKQFIKKLVK